MPLMYAVLLTDEESAKVEGRPLRPFAVVPEPDEGPEQEEGE